MDKALSNPEADQYAQKKAAEAATEKALQDARDKALQKQTDKAARDKVASEKQIADEKAKKERASFNFTRMFGTVFGTTGAICNTTFNFNSTFGRNELSLNPIPVSITEGMNPYEATVTYNYSFNNRPQNIVPNALSESLSVDDNSAIATFIPILMIIPPMLRERSRSA